MNFSLYIARRYFISKSNNNAINIISYLALLGVMGTALALFVVLSAFGGLKTFSLSFANQYDPDLKIIPIDSKKLTLDDNTIFNIENINGVQFASKTIEEKVLLDFKNKKLPAVLKAIDTNYYKISTIQKTLYQGQWLSPDYPNHIVIGNGISRQLSAGILDQSGYLNLIVPKPGKGQITNPNNAFKEIPTRVSGIFVISDEYDNTYIYSPLALAKKLLGFTSKQYSAIELSIRKDADIQFIKNEIQKVIDQKVETKTRFQLNDELYKMLNTENLMVYLISTLVVIIALFNLIGSIIMSILDKKENIKTLSYLGANKSQINTIFFLQGIITSLIGTIIGVVIGSIFVLLQIEYKIIKITSTIAYPVEWSYTTLAIVLATSIGLGAIASKIASSRAAKLV